ncbi:MAG: tripartite tricarboxylate transporter substrate-binding protein, partial [Lachnospiraceae bacterium]|nr:tripartite tricarboxylate transporter substrate-binding protein [Lachnospiraceae bacterium]
MKKMMAAVLGAAMVLNLAACSGGDSASATTAAAAPESSAASAGEGAAVTSEYPVDKVTLLCPSDAGGAMDQNCRLVAPYLEKYLGVPVEVTNMGGSACWIGWSYLYNEAAKDGSYISYANFPNMITGYLDTTNTTGLDNTSFGFLEMFTSDTNIILAAAGEERFTDLESMLEYAKDNVLTIADAGARTDDAVCVAQLEKAAGVNLQHVHFENTAGGMAAIQGKQVDLLVCNVSEAVEPVESGAVSGIGIIDTERSSFLPDLQCTGDLDYDISCASSRGFICAQDMDESAKALVCQALEAMMEDPDLQAAAETAGI